jgi:FG-GAP repeat
VLGSQAGQRLGGVHAVGDFNADGFVDLVAGLPSRDVGGAGDAGAALVIYGSSSRLDVRGDRGTPAQLWTHATPGVIGAAESSNRFGDALATGDFDGNRFTDLAIGVTGENREQGGVNVLYGSLDGLTTARAQFWSQSSTGVPGLGEAFECFGAALAAGDFNDDRKADLAIASPGENGSAGAVHVLYGSGGFGPSATGHRPLRRGTRDW